MRIIMLTHDSYINQRILFIAETLYQIGHEIIIIGRIGENLPNFEVINQIKIERIHQNQSFLSSNQLKLLRKITSLLPKPFFKLAQKSNKIFSNFYLYLVRKLICQNINFDSNLVEKVCYYRPDVIHVHDYCSLFTGVSVKKKLNIPLIYERYKPYGNQSDIPNRLLKKEKKLIQHTHACLTFDHGIPKDFNFQEPSSTKHDRWVHEAEIVKNIYQEI